MKDLSMSLVQPRRRAFDLEPLDGNRELRSVHEILDKSATFGENSTCFSMAITFDNLQKYQIECVAYQLAVPRSSLPEGPGFDLNHVYKDTMHS